MAEHKTMYFLIGGLLGAAAAAYFFQHNERVRVAVGERAVELQSAAQEQAKALKSQLAETSAADIAARQAAVSAEVERRLSEGKESLQAMLARVRQELAGLEAKDNPALTTVQEKLQIARKRAELLALEARSRIRGEEELEEVPSEE